MRAVVVYESIYGNTRAIAAAIADGLGERADVALLRVADADPATLKGAQLLVVGSPTHMHGLPTSLSRRMAVQAAHEDGHTAVEPEADEGSGLRAWLSELAAGDVSAAAFDTRIDRSALLTGTAARGIARRLQRRGCTLVAEPESFFVEEGEGPLADGEAERARQWGASLAARVER